MVLKLTSKSGKYFCEIDSFSAVGGTQCKHSGVHWRVFNSREHLHRHSFLLQAKCTGLPQNLLLYAFFRIKTLGLTKIALFWSYLRPDKQKIILIIEFLKFSKTIESEGEKITIFPKLQDILSDDRVRLDLMFKMALSTDLVKGLMYIHRSAIEYHGNLTSSNCLVDDHWTLKLSDFGIRSLRRTLGDNVLKSGRALMEGTFYEYGRIMKLIRIRL